MPAGRASVTGEALVGALRERIARALPRDCFVLVSRIPGALFVTDAPARHPDGDWETFSVSRFRIAREARRLFFSPDEAVIEQFERDSDREAASDLARSLARCAPWPVSSQAIVIFSEGLRLLALEDQTRQDAYEQSVRRFAALALRTHQGGAYGCALLLDDLERRRQADNAPILTRPVTAPSANSANQGGCTL